MSSEMVSKYHVPRWRVFLVYGVIIAVVGLVIYRLVSLQIFDPANLDQSID